jgi:hypothetical protein
VKTQGQTSSSQETSDNQEIDSRSDFNPVIQSKSPQEATVKDLGLKNSENATSLEINSQNEDSVYSSMLDNESVQLQGYSAMQQTDLVIPETQIVQIIPAQGDEITPTTDPVVPDNQVVQTNLPDEVLTTQQGDFVTIESPEIQEEPPHAESKTSEKNSFNEAAPVSIPLRRQSPRHLSQKVLLQELTKVTKINFKDMPKNKRNQKK